MCFWDCCKWSGRAHRDRNIIYQFLWGYVHSYQDSFNLQQRTNRGSLQNWEGSIRPKKMLTERGIKSCINRPNTHWKRRSEWQRGIIIKFMNKLSSSVSASVWKGMKDIPNYKTPSPRTVENRQLADELNEFYCRFEKTPHTRPEHLSTHPLAPPSTPLSPTPALTISEDGMRQVFRENKRKHQDQTVCHQPALKSALTSWPPSSHRSSTDHWSCAKSPHASNAPQSSPSQRNPKLLDLMTTDMWL